MTIVTRTRTVHSVADTAAYVYGVNDKNQTIAIPYADNAAKLAAVEQGRYATFIVAAESSRSGEITYRVDLGAREVPDNEKDRAFHVEGTMPDRPETDVNRDLIAYSYLLETDHHGPLGGEVRGIKGIVRGNGGEANLRSAHFLTESYNGHTGNLTGVLADIFRSDGDPTDVPPTGDKSAAFRGQVGAGITNGMVVSCRFSPSTPAEPQNLRYGFRVEEGGNAARCTVACFQGHGGGGGSLFRGLASDLDPTEIFNVRASGHTTAPAYSSGVEANVADDSVFSFVPPQPSGILLVHCAGSAAQCGMVAYVTTTGATGSLGLGASAEVTNGVLTGTTGTDGKLTISCHTDGNIYIENRLGSDRNISYTFFTARY